MRGLLIQLGLCSCFVLGILCVSAQAQKGAVLADAHYKRGLEKLQNGECEEAVKDFDKAIELKPTHARSFMHRRQCLDELLEIEKAIADLGTAIKLDPRQYFAFKTRGDIHARIGKFREAIADYTNALNLAPRDNDALSARAAAYREVGESRLAEIDERKAEKAWELLINDPSTVAPTLTVTGIRSRRIRPTLLSEAELTDSYVRSIKQIELVPDSTERVRALALEKIGKLTKILQVNPNFGGAYFERGNNYAKLGELDKAIADFSKAIGLDPNDHRSFNNRGIACARTGNYERAIADFARALFIAPSDHSRLYNFGLVLLNMGRFQQSASLVGTYIGKEPNDFKAYQLRALANRKLGKTTEAESDEKTAQRMVVGK